MSGGLVKRRALRRAGEGVFRELHEALGGAPLDLSDLDLGGHPKERVELAKRVWQSRVETELRSVQIMARFLSEVVGAGDPIEVWSGAADLVQDEIHHVDLCAQLVTALGAEPLLPEPLVPEEPERFMKAPMADRALSTAISMLAINETLSVAFVEDLRDRCTDPAVHRVLDATVEDEEGHQDFGWSYIERSLARYPIATLSDWRHLVKETLRPHEEMASRILAEVPAEAQRLEAHPEPDLARLGLFGPVRQALVFRRCFEEQLAPKLRRLKLLED